MANPNPNEVFTGGATTSQHIEAQDDDHFNNTTFKLKRTRSLGLLDEFINPLEKADKDNEEEVSPPIPSMTSTTSAPALPLEDDASFVSDILEPTPNDSTDKLSINTSVDDDHHATIEADNPKVQRVVSPSYKSPEFIPHDDNDITVEPSIHVDYFSHQWDVSDISKSWRYVIQKRKDVTNSARLENASWRTWAQRRSNLKTINPEELNWSKENDITWLYGPIVKDDADTSDDENDHDSEHKESKHKHSSNTASSKVAGDISIPSKHSKKGILKKRSVQDVMISHANLVKLEAMENRLKAKKEEQREQYRKYNEEMNKKKGHSRTNSNEPPEFDDYDAISQLLNSQYRVSSNQNSSVNLKSLNQSATNLNAANNTTGKESSSSTGVQGGLVSSDSKEDSDQIVNESNISDLSKKLSHEVSHMKLEDDSEAENTNGDSKKERTIHFNDVVEQCIAVDDDYIYDSDLNTDLEDDDEYDYYPDNKNQQSYIFSKPDDLNNDYDYEYKSNEDDQDYADDDYDEDDDDDGGFFLKVKSSSTLNQAREDDNTSSQKTIDRQSNDPSPASQKTNDTDSISTTNSKAFRSIQLLPPTTLNYGSDEETSDEDNPYTSSVSHNVNNSSSRGYDYYYDYNTVYTVDPTNGMYRGDKSDANVPDVVDLPEDLAPYQGYAGQSPEADSLPVLDSQVISNNNIIYNSQNSNGDDNNSSLSSPVSHIPPGLPQPGQGGFSFNDSDSDDSDDSDSDEGLSISTRSSSQSLAQQAFQQMTPVDNQNSSEEPESDRFSLGYNPTPVSESLAAINPRHSSTGLSKQSTSSNSLSNQFFGTTPLTKDPSTSSLADSFFNTSSTVAPLERPSPSYPQTTQPKSSPLPPHTTSANAFSGNTTPPLESQRKPSRSTFSFDSSDSEDEDEYVENVSAPVNPSHSPSNNNPEYTSYNSLSQVAGKSGISSPEEKDTSRDRDDKDKKLVDQAKGLANHFLGTWKSD